MQPEIDKEMCIRDRLMGFVIDDTGLWPRVLGLESPFPQGKYDKYL